VSVVEGSIQLPPDSTGKAFRLVEITETQDDVGYVAEFQEVVTLAGPDGSIIGVMDAGSLKVTEDETRCLLRALVLRLDILNAAIDKGYSPPDDLALEVV
jgi:hypothetical protein